MSPKVKYYYDIDYVNSFCDLNFVRAVVKKQQQKQYELEKAEEALSAKVAQRDAILKEIQAESVISYEIYNDEKSSIYMIRNMYISLMHWY